MTTVTERARTEDDEPICNVVTVNPHAWNGRTIVMTHGAYHNASHYLRTFDDRPGWAYDFAGAGYRVLLADYPGTGDSPPVVDPTVIDSPYICRGLARVIESVDGPVDLLVHSMSGTYGIALLESHGHLIDHLVAVAASPPAEIARRSTLVEDLGDAVRCVYGTDERIVPKHGWTAGDRAFAIHCMGTGSRFPETDPDVYAATFSPLWAGLSIERAVECLDPPPSTAELAGAKVLVISGTHDLGHTPEVEQRMTDWLNAHGAAAQYLGLGSIGIDGNAHMLMLEDNSAEIATIIMEWLANH